MTETTITPTPSDPTKVDLAFHFLGRINAVVALIVATLGLPALYQYVFPSADIVVYIEPPSSSDRRAHATNRGSLPASLLLDGVVSSEERTCDVRFNVGAGGSVDDLVIAPKQARQYIMLNAGTPCNMAGWNDCELNYKFMGADGVVKDRTVPYPCGSPSE